MPLPDGRSTGTMELVELEYLNWEPEGSPVAIHMHRDTIAAISRDVTDAWKTLARPVPETGGLLLGRVEAGERPTVWIERYQRVNCRHKAGPRFVLDEEDTDGLEKAAADVLAGGETAVVGFYRSHLRDGLQLEESDLDLVRRYFSDAADLILLIKPENPSKMAGQFFTHGAGTGGSAVGPDFPFHGHPAVGEAEEPLRADATPRDRPRRLVPDFAPLENAGLPAEPPAAEQVAPPEPAMPERVGPEPRFNWRTETEPRSKWRTAIPLAGAFVLVGGLLWFGLQQAHRPAPAAAPVAATEQGRPIGLSVEPAGPAWQVSWNPNATALAGARSVQLFVREGDDQTRKDLTPQDLALGMYTYQSGGNDLTFRLEVIDNSGRVSAESFRYEREAKSTAPPAPALAPAPPPTAAPKPARSVPPKSTSAKIIEPKVIYRAPPVVAAGIRPRIKSTVTIDVRVQIDVRGRVVSAAPINRPPAGLDAYLASTAVQAARQWRFEPARQNGRAVPGSQTIHFVFER
jgi:Gram-negative bacterial TonB protein C-terminal